MRRTARSRERLALPQASFELPGLALDTLLLMPKLEQVPRAADELLVTDGRLHEIGCAGLEGVETKAAILVGREHDDRNIGHIRQLPQAPREIGSVHAGHLEVRDDEVGRVGLRPFQHREGAAKRLHVHVLFDEPGQLRVDALIAALVVDDDYQRHPVTRMKS